MFQHIKYMHMQYSLALCCHYLQAQILKICVPTTVGFCLLNRPLNWWSNCSSTLQSYVTWNLWAQGFILADKSVSWLHTIILLRDRTQFQHIIIIWKICGGWFTIHWLSTGSQQQVTYYLCRLIMHDCLQGNFCLVWNHIY